jgi:glutathione S-transferase
MKLYGEAMPAPNPRRVRIFLAEKGLEIPEIPDRHAQGGHKSPEHLARNSLGQVPVLELDDGTTISETVAICRYFEVLHPDAAAVRRHGAWSRPRSRCGPAGRVPPDGPGRHVLASRPSAHGAPAEAEQGVRESNREVVEKTQMWLDRELADGRPFLTGETYTIADIAGRRPWTSPTSRA